MQQRNLNIDENVMRGNIGPLLAVQHIELECIFLLCLPAKVEAVKQFCLKELIFDPQGRSMIKSMITQPFSLLRRHKK